MCGFFTKALGTVFVLLLSPRLFVCSGCPSHEWGYFSVLLGSYWCVGKLLIFDDSLASFLDQHMPLFTFASGSSILDFSTFLLLPSLVAFLF